MDDALGFTCLIALDELVDVLPSPLRHAIAVVAPTSSVSISEVDAPRGTAQAFRIDIDNQLFGAALFDGAMPAEEYAFAEQKSLFWQDAGIMMQGHGAFLAISADHVETVHGLARAQAVALTRLAAAFCEALPARGVYWRGADTLSAPSSIARAASSIRQGKWPVDVWIGWQMYGDDEADPMVLGLHTRGARDFLGFELEIPPFAVTDKKEPLRILHAASAYLMNFGDVIRDGQHVEVIGERRTDYTLHMGANGNPEVARLTVLENDQRK